MLDGCTPWPEEFARRYIQQGFWESKNLAELLRERAAAFPNRILVADGDKRLSYRDVDRLSDRLAVRLLERGFKPRDIVLLQLPNRWEFIIIFFALLKIGVIPVMCLPPHRRAELEYFARLTEAKGYFFAPAFRHFDYVALARELQASVPSLEYLVALGEGAERGVSYLDPWLEAPSDEPLAEEASRALNVHRPDPFDVAFFLLSGGTTGVPKLIPRTHSDYIYNARECARVLEYGPDTVFMIVIPAAHNFPLGAPGMVAAVWAGGSVAMSAATDPETVFETIERHKGTFLAVSPALLIMLLNSHEKSRFDLSSLRFVCAGGQKMLPELVDRTRAAWNFLTIGHAFGMAEGLINLTLPSDSMEVIRETQGRPISPGDEIRIVDEAGREVAAGEPGELLTRGPYTIRGYYKAEEHNHLAFTPDGFYRTGDIVRMHHSGNLIVEGRKKDMINRGGEKISAEEVENLLLNHESVHMTAVVAMPDPVMGEKTCAFVIPRPGRALTLGDLTHFLIEKKIAKFKLPERLEIVESFPLTGVGKVSKKDLRAQIAEKLIAEEQTKA